jgi:hypothetical protein
MYEPTFSFGGAGTAANVGAAYTPDTSDEHNKTSDNRCCNLVFSIIIQLTIFRAPRIVLN